MTIELRPLGIKCNLACHYCYQNPQRDAGNQRQSYDLEKMKAAALKTGGPFNLFGGEPLLIPLDDLEHLFAWGLETYGSNGIQTNGVLITSQHIDLFRRYKVSVGISIDGPGSLNDARWNRGLQRTRKSTAQVENVIAQLCREYQPPGIIVTLHKGNATSDKLPQMAEWMLSLDAMGIKSVRLHLLEVDHKLVQEKLALSKKENVEALLVFANLEENLKNIQFDLFREMEYLLEGQDGKASCTWRACDPYTTSAVQGIEGNGQTSNCGRTNKEGIGFIKADLAGYERQVALHKTPQSEKGCGECRFFLMCKGQCPGTAIDGDWRNRTEHCEVWKSLFSVIEKRMIISGKVPLTIQPQRFDLEKRMVEYWQRGRNPSVGWLLKVMEKQGPSSEQAIAANSKNPPRISWVSEKAREIWQPRFTQLQPMLEDMTVYMAKEQQDHCSVRLVPGSSFHRLMNLATEHGLGAAILPKEVLPNAIAIKPGEGRMGVFIAGTPSAVAKAQKSHKLLDLPEGYLEAQHAPLAPLGISALQTSEQWLKIAENHGYTQEVSWLRECASWSTSWSILHGILEIKTPVFKMCIQANAEADAQEIQHIGVSKVAGSTTGLSFPYAAPTKRRSFKSEDIQT